jgi:hypothetical protein
MIDAIKFFFQELSSLIYGFSCCNFEAFGSSGLDFIVQGNPVFYCNRMGLYN